MQLGDKDRKSTDDETGEKPKTEHSGHEAKEEHTEHEKSTAD